LGPLRPAADQPRARSRRLPPCEPRLFSMAVRIAASTFSSAFLCVASGVARLAPFSRVFKMATLTERSGPSICAPPPRRFAS